MTTAEPGGDGVRDCAVFVTHKWSPRIAAHYARLKREAGTQLDVFLAYQPQGAEVLPADLDADLVVHIPASAEHFPLRYQEYESRGHETPWGYVDLVWMTAFLDPRLTGYDRFWLVEYDVDFSGDWGRFFSAARHYAGDLLTARLRPLSVNPRFYYANRYRQPETAPLDPLIAFMPISRLSRRLVEHYRDTLRLPGWAGHFEMVLPSIAAAGGLGVAEIGGDDLFTPPERRGLHYGGTHRELDFGSSTHGYRPARGYRYFGEAPRRFRQPDCIYHPIKVDFTLWQRLRTRERALRHQFRAFSRRLRGKS